MIKFESETDVFIPSNVKLVETVLISTIFIHLVHDFHQPLYKGEHLPTPQVRPARANVSVYPIWRQWHTQCSISGVSCIDMMSDRVQRVPDRPCSHYPNKTPSLCHRNLSETEASLFWKFLWLFHFCNFANSFTILCIEW